MTRLQWVSHPNWRRPAQWDTAEYHTGNAQRASTLQTCKWNFHGPGFLCRETVTGEVRRKAEGHQLELWREWSQQWAPSWDLQTRVRWELRTRYSPEWSKTSKAPRRRSSFSTGENYSVRDSFPWLLFTLLVCLFSQLLRMLSAVTRKQELSVWHEGKWKQPCRSLSINNLLT